MNGTAPNAVATDEPSVGGAEDRLGSTVEEMGECSFPASDPPAVWTWEVGESSPGSGLSGRLRDE
jgi:hypothetical protein